MLKGYEITPIGNLVSKVFEDIDFNPDKNDFISIANKWEQLVGEKIANNSKIVDATNGILKVEVTHPGWYQLVQMNQEKILKKVIKNYPEFKVDKILITLKK